MTSYLRQQDYIDASTAADVYLSSNEAKIRQLSNEALEESLCHDETGKERGTHSSNHGFARSYEEEQRKGAA